MLYNLKGPVVSTSDPAHNKLYQQRRYGRMSRCVIVGGADIGNYEYIRNILKVGA